MEDKSDVAKMMLMVPKKVYNWISMVAKKDGVKVEDIAESVLHEVYQFKEELRSIKRFYNVKAQSSNLTSLSQVLGYAIGVGAMVHHIAKHLLDDLESDGKYVLSDIKLVEDEPGAYRGVYLEFTTRDVENSNIDYFMLQIQHDGLYLDAVSTLSFNSKKRASEALRRLKKAAMEIVDTNRFKSIEEKVSQDDGKLNIDISEDDNVVYLTFMAYARSMNFLPKLHEVDAVLRGIYEVAGIERRTREK
ncbi:MAG: hypothetical protein N3F04_03505 [Candidatus Nezhaarchaeota archaeon]|nr:hypothetical protein [Candidatus Nezhaarchaeota archaeon]MCX8141830.1 hypothetical protein [Candidatus Nezhaarchaeota archaeon]MDW8050389.1 hypothetical protein [Nitrososphaerota archaeon]